GRADISRERLQGSLMGFYEADGQKTQAKARHIILRLIADKTSEVLSDLAEGPFRLFQQGALSRLGFSGLECIVGFIDNCERSAFSPYTSDPLLDESLSPEAEADLDGAIQSDFQILREFRNALADWANKYSYKVEWKKDHVFFNWLLRQGLSAM